MFSLIKNHLQKIYATVTTKLHSLFSRPTLDEQTLKELELLLIQADTGVKTTHFIIDALQKQYAAGTLKEGSDLYRALKQQLISILETAQPTPSQCSVYLMVGINGSGKTTFTSKLAHHLQQQGKKVLLVAADTFRAAATEQLSVWAERTQTAIVVGAQGQDPASVVFTGCEKYKNEQYDALIIDTAGRLQTKTNLMKELEKIKKTIARLLPDSKICTLLTVDAMLGQNSLEQAKIFHEATQLDGIVLTKMDGTGKGGIVFAIAQELHIPISFISFGETMEDYRIFDAQEYVEGLLNSSNPAHD